MKNVNNKSKKWAKHLKTSNPKLIKELGFALGYPDCCIKGFQDIQQKLNSNAEPKRSDRQRLKAAHVDEVFTGFIPCSYHAKQIIKGKCTLQSLINDRSDEFPAFPSWELNDSSNPDNKTACIIVDKGNSDNCVCYENGDYVIRNRTGYKGACVFNKQSAEYFLKEIGLDYGLEIIELTNEI